LCWGNTHFYFISHSNSNSKSGSSPFFDLAEQPFPVFPSEKNVMCLGKLRKYAGGKGNGFGKLGGERKLLALREAGRVVEVIVIEYA
jgi:hypothetical protein